MIVGIDPGIVHTGCVRLIIDTVNRQILKEYHVIDGLDVDLMLAWSMRFGPIPNPVVVEKYVPRQKLAQDTQMVQAEAAIKQMLPNVMLLQNTGVKQMVPLPLLSVFGLEKFSTPTHHGDLLSAARIMLAGMSKDIIGNTLMADAVKAHLDSEPFEIIDIGGMDELPG